MSPRALPAAVAAVILTTVLSALTAPPAAASAPPALFGVSDVWESQVAHDEQELSDHSGIVGTFLNWSTASPAATGRWLRWVRSRRAAPMLDLVPPSTVRLSAITRGGQDRHLRAFAQVFARWGHPMWLRVLPEMNGRWEPYSPGTHGQTAGQYVAAFRHVVTVMRRAGARNVRMMWNPNRVFRGSTPLRRLWPGAGYVDWTGIDAYNFHDARHGSFTPYRLLAPTVRAIRSLTGKPTMVAELGCAPFPGKPTWVAHALPTVSELGLRAISWFDEQLRGGPDWRLDSVPNPATLRAARRAVHGAAVAWPGHGLRSIGQVDRFVVTGRY